MRFKIVNLYTVFPSNNLSTKGEKKLPVLTINFVKPSNRNLFIGSLCQVKYSSVGSRNCIHCLKMRTKKVEEVFLLVVFRRKLAQMISSLKCIKKKIYLMLRFLVGLPGQRLKSIGFSGKTKIGTGLFK